jgi:hypothetical protein
MVSMYTKSMTRVQKKRRPGRPRGTTYRETIPVRLTEEAAAAVDAWAVRQNERGISRSEAIRRLVDQALAVEAGGRKGLDAAASRAVREARTLLERLDAVLARIEKARGD